MKKSKKIFIATLYAFALLFFFKWTVFAKKPYPLAPWYMHDSGVTELQDYCYLKNKIKKIVNIQNEDIQMQKIQKLSDKYMYDKINMPSVEPQFILDLCNIVAPIQSTSVKVKIVEKIFFQLLYRQLIYDNNKANFWTRKENLKLFKSNQDAVPTFERRIYCDFFRVLTSKRGVCRNYVNVMKVIFDKLNITNFLIYSDKHIFNAYLDKEIKSCDLTYGDISYYLMPPDERFAPPSKNQNIAPKAYIDKYYKIKEKVSGVFIPYKSYNTKDYKQAVDSPESYFKFIYNPLKKRRELKIVINNCIKLGKASSQDILDLYNISY